MRISDWSSDVCSSDLDSRIRTKTQRLLNKLSRGIPPKGVVHSPVLAARWRNQEIELPTISEAISRFARLRRFDLPVVKHGSLRYHGCPNRYHGLYHGFAWTPANRREQAQY